MNGGVQRRRRPRLTIAREAGDLYSSPPQQQRDRDHRSPMNAFEESAAAGEWTTTAPQSRSHSMDSIHMYVHSDHSETTAETRSSGGGGGGVCSDDSDTTADSTTSRSTGRSSVISIQLKMQKLSVVNVSSYILDSGDKFINLPDDLLKEVFSRITVKEFVRMGCLNKVWHLETLRLINDDGHNFN